MADIRYQKPVVVFDLDDTIFRERDFCRSGFKFLCDPDSYRVFESSDYPSQESLQALEKDMGRALEERRNPFDEFEKFFIPRIPEGEKFDIKQHIDAYRSHVPQNLEIEPGVAKVLEYLHTEGIKMGLITDGRSVTQRLKIKALGLEKYIAPDMIFISEETGFDKTKKENFAAVVRKYPEASEFFYVADNTAKDFCQPNQLGWTTVKIPYNSDNVHLDDAPPSPLHQPTETPDDIFDYFHKKITSNLRSNQA